MLKALHPVQKCPQNFRPFYFSTLRYSAYWMHFYFIKVSMIKPPNNKKWSYQCLFSIGVFYRSFKNPQILSSCFQLWPSPKISFWDNVTSRVLAAQKKKKSQTKKSNLYGYPIHSAPFFSLLCRNQQITKNPLTKSCWSKQSGTSAVSIIPPV